MEKENYPLIIIAGLDPEKHEIPPLLIHHLRKMQKDFVTMFLPKENIKEGLEKDLQKILEKIEFQPKDKKRIII